MKEQQEYWGPSRVFRYCVQAQAGTKRTGDIEIENDLHAFLVVSHQ